MLALLRGPPCRWSAPDAIYTEGCECLADRKKAGLPSPGQILVHPWLSLCCGRSVLQSPSCLTYLNSLVGIALAALLEVQSRLLGCVCGGGEGEEWIPADPPPLDRLDNNTERNDLLPQSKRLLAYFVVGVGIY